MPLPELLAWTEASEDITIQIEPQFSSSNLPFSYSIEERRASIHFPLVGTFEMKDGVRMLVKPIREAEERLIRLPLLGAAFAVLLHQRGKFVLHASAVSINGGAVIFLGNKGYGKSTMAATLCGRGHNLLADDTVAIDFDDHLNQFVLPAFPQFKLYPDAVIATSSDDPNTLEEVAANHFKRSKVAEGFCKVPQPLKAVYVLGEGPVIRERPLHPQEALPALIANTYMARFDSQWMTSGVARANLTHCARLVNSVSIYALERPRDLRALDKVARIVEDYSFSK